MADRTDKRTSTSATAARRTVVFVHSSDPDDHLGGGETTLIALARGLAASDSPHGFRPVVVVSGPGEFARRLRAAGVTTRIVAMDPLYYKLAQTSTRQRMTRMAAAVPSVLGLARVIRAERAALVCSNVQGAHIYGALAGRLTRRPVVMYLRDIPHGPFSSKFLPFWARLFADRLIGISPAVGDFYRSSSAHGARLSERLAIIPNGIDLRAFDPSEPDPGVRAELKLTDATPVITLIGRLQPLKGQHLLIAALPRIIARWPRAKVLLVGDAFAYQRSHRETLQELARTHSVAHAVHFTGQRTDIRNLLSVSDIVVSASSHEAFGRTIVEAMAMAKPVVATRSGGPDSIVSDGQTGSLIPTNDPEALAAALIRMWSDPSAARAMGMRGRKRALAHFDLPAMVEREVIEFTKTLASRRS